MMRRLGVLALISLAVPLMQAAPALAVVPSATVAASSVLPAVPGTTAPVGNVAITESAPGQLTVGDVITLQLKDAAAGATLHMTTTPVVSGTNGLAATLAVASSSGNLADEVKLTVTTASSGSFPGVLTVAQLNPVIDAGAATGNASAFVSDTAAAVAGGASAVVANLISAGTLKASFSAVSQPTLLSTGSNQSGGALTIAEPAKDFFKTGDVITFRVRDVNGSADTVGLAATPLASGGAMSVSVQGLNGTTVQPNESGFKVSIDAQDPANGSTSTLTVSNLVFNTAQAPSGPLTITASVTSGAATEYVVPGRIVDANVGGNTDTTSSGEPYLTIPGTGQVASNVTISVAPGALRAGDTFTLAIQEPGVTFTTASPPTTSLTAGNLSLSTAAATLDGTHSTATWTVANPSSTASTIVVGPIYYDVAGGATNGDAVTLKASGQGSFSSQTVGNAVLLSSATGTFAAASTPPVSTSSASPVVLPGTDVVFKESSTGSLPANNSAIVLLSPYANQIAAYRTTFTAAPTATVNAGGLTLGSPIVNSSTITVTTSGGVISAPAQTAVIFPVTGASTGTPAQVTFSGISYQLGNFVPPAALVATGTANSGTGVVTASSTTVAGSTVAGNQYVDAIDGNGLGSSSAGDTTPPETFLDAGPANGSTVFNTSSVTFYFHSSEDPFATFTCTLISQTTAGDSSTVFENHCGQPSGTSPVTYSKTYPSLSNGHYTFYVQATDAANNTDPTPAASTFDIGFDVTAPTAVLTTPTTVAPGTTTATFSEKVTSVVPADATLFTGTTSVAHSLVCRNGSTVSNCQTGPVTSLSVVPSAALVPGQTYTATLNPAGAVSPITDLAGNHLAPTAKTFRASLNEQESSAAARPAWRTVATSAASGGSYVIDHLAGASAAYTFTGTSVSWVTVTGTAEGTAYVYVDNVLKASVNNYATSTHYGVVRTVSGLSSATHTVKVLVRGVKGSSAATDSLVAVDDFLAGGVKTESSSGAVHYIWRSVATSSASGGRYAIDDLAGASTSFTFKGTAISWYTVTGPAMGKANVYIDGVLKATVDNYSAATAYGVRRSFGSLSNAVHTMKIVVLGQHRSTSKGNGIAIDRWVIS
jgi:hypothetical protein